MAIELKFPFNQAETSIASNPDNNNILVGAAIDRPGDVPRILIYRSLTGGQSFASRFEIVPEITTHFSKISPPSLSSFSIQEVTDVTHLPIPPNIGPISRTFSMSDPVVAANVPDTFHVTTLVVNGTQSVITVYTSMDNGHTFDTITNAHTELNPMVVDKPYIATDTNFRSRQFRRVYLAYTRAQVDASRNFTHSEILFQFSATQGSRFFDPITLATSVENTFVLGANITVGSDGAVYVSWIETNTQTNQATFFVRRSNDGGVIFDPPVAVRTNFTKVADSLPLFGSLVLRNSTFSYLSTNLNPRFDGAIYAVWQEKVGNLSQIMFSISTNLAATWSPPVNITNNAFDNILPFLVTVPFGTIGVAYYKLTRNVITGVPLFLNVFLSTSFDGGRSFTTEQINDFPIRPFNLPVLPGGAFIGDYIGATSTPFGIKVAFAGQDPTDVTEDIFLGPIVTLGGRAPTP